jgi:hypothetical protein
MALIATLAGLFPYGEVDIREARPTGFAALVDEGNTEPKGCDIIVNLVEAATDGAPERVHYVVRTADRVLKLAITAVQDEPGLARINGHVVVNTWGTPVSEIDAAVSKELAQMSESWARGQLMFISYRSPGQAEAWHSAL